MVIDENEELCLQYLMSESRINITHQYEYIAMYIYLHF
jgi:hypothetical protein